MTEKCFEPLSRLPPKVTSFGARERGWGEGTGAVRLNARAFAPSALSPHPSPLPQAGEGAHRFVA
ncbi:hypothetical protein [Lysobacter gummosus]|uniref:hypothetical protein n=1 Tax=Lysobacter gummosus TaxID=262324 RepID=UPI00363737C7